VIDACSAVSVAVLFVAGDYLIWLTVSFFYFLQRFDQVCVCVKCWAFYMCGHVRFINVVMTTVPRFHIMQLYVVTENLDCYDIGPVPK